MANPWSVGPEPLGPTSTPKIRLRHSRNQGTASRGFPEPLWMFDRSALGEAARRLDASGFRWDFARQRWSAKVTRQFPDRFVPWLKSLPLSLELDLRGELASFLQSEVAGTVKLEVQESGIDWFDLSVIVDVSDTSLSQDEIKLLLNARGKWVRLSDKGWRKLEFKLSAEEDEQLARLGLNPHELSSEKQRLHAPIGRPRRPPIPLGGKLRKGRTPGC